MEIGDNIHDTEPRYTFEDTLYGNALPHFGSWKGGKGGLKY